MISGAREAGSSWFRRLIAGAVARELSAFVVPGPEVARARGLDLRAAGLQLSDTPRHASVLVLIGEPPEALKEAAAVAYAQMPRPRSVLSVGAEDISPLPGPDASAGLEQDGVERAVAGLRRLFAENAFAPEVTEFDVDAIRTRTEYVCSMHPEVVRDEPGMCPVCGMDLVPRESAGGEDHGSHEEMDHGEAGHEHADHGEADQDDMDHGEGSSGHYQEPEPGEDFMSMIEMTQGTPRSSDGLQMEWVEAPFGPLFPGLPAGLTLNLTLDGDTVAEAGAESAAGRTLESLAGPAASLPDRMARLDPLSPVAYRLLDLRAAEDAAGIAPDERTALARAGALERERAASHLNWLAGFAHLLGYAWLEERAARLQLDLLRAASAEEAVLLRDQAAGLTRRVERTPLLARKLRGIGELPGNAETSGPVARARGLSADTRAGEEPYRTLGFEPVVREGDDSFSRLVARLAEVEQSLELLREAGSVSTPASSLDGAPSGAGAATVETPRGAATLRLTLEDGEAREVGLDTPSTTHFKLVADVAEQQELANALVGVGSLDISPWTVVR